MTITYAAADPATGWGAEHCACTHLDPGCGRCPCVVVVLEDGEWLGHALCASHAPTSALRSLAATEPARGCTPPAATEERGEATRHAAPAPGGSTSGGAA